MKKTIIFLSSMIIGIFFLGCSAKTVEINARMPAKVDALTKSKNIAVLPFKNDNINLSDRIKTKLASVIIDGKPYFNILERDKINVILKELKLQASNLVGKKNARYGKMMGAQILIRGSVKSFAKDGSHKRPEQECVSFNKKGRCLNYRTIYVTCRTSTASLNVGIYAVDVSTGQYVDGANFTKDYIGDSCKDEYSFQEANEALNNLADEIAEEYVERVAPHTVTMYVELIENVDTVDLNSRQEKRFKQALKYIEDGRLDAAEKVLQMLNSEIGGKSYEILYDLGVVKEGLGKLNEAQAAYNKADRIIMYSGIEPNELVNKAIKRINEMIVERQKLKSQLR